MPAANEDQHPRKQEPNWIDIWTFGVLTLTLVAAVFYASVAYKQWGVMERTLTASERAWELLDSVDLKRTVRLPDGKTTRYQIIFRNFGKGPATDVSSCAEATEERKPNWKSYICDIHTEIVAPPGGEVYITVDGPAFPDLVKQVYIRGAVKYLDQFGIARHTEYCTSPVMRLDNTVSIGGCARNRAN